MGKWCPHASSFIFYRIIIKVAGNQDRHKSLDEFDFGPDQTTHFGVTCPWMTKILHFRTWISLRPVGQSWSNFMCIIIGVEKGCIMFWDRLDKNSGVHGNRKPPLTYNGGKWCLHLFWVAFDLILFILAGNEDMHKISDEFKFQPDWTTDYGISCSWTSNRLITGEWCLHASSLIFDRIIIKAAGNQDRHKSLVDFGPNQTTHFGVTCPWVMKISHFRSQLANLDQILCSIIGVGERLHKVLGQIDHGTLDSGERSLPFGLLV